MFITHDLNLGIGMAIFFLAALMRLFSLPLMARNVFIL
jgi:hypothetical protein